MLSLLEVKKSIVKKLKYIHDVNIVSNEIKDGFDKPAFFIQLIPLGTTTDCDIQETRMNVYIHYFPKEKTDLELLKMIDRLNNLFVTTLTVDDIPLTIYNKDSDMDDNVLKYIFTIKYSEDTPVAIDEVVGVYDNMQELYVNKERWS